MSIPVRLGGSGADWATTLRAVRTISRADGSLGHVFGFQHLLLATVRLFGTPAQFDALARDTVKQRWFWGNALNPLDTRTRLVQRGDEFAISGTKSFCSGARDADMLVVSATDAVNGQLIVAVVPASRPGIAAHGDWDNMGQRQTDSGTVVFDNARVLESEILAHPGPLGSPFASLRPLVAQLTLVNVYIGLAEGAFEAARTLTRERGKGWFASGVERIVDDPYVLASFGDLYCELEGARLHRRRGRGEARRGVDPRGRAHDPRARRSGGRRGRRQGGRDARGLGGDQPDLRRDRCACDDGASRTRSLLAQPADPYPA